jgi:hypothetical protein
VNTRAAASAVLPSEFDVEIKKALVELGGSAASIGNPDLCA